MFLKNKKWDQVAEANKIFMSVEAIWVIPGQTTRKNLTVKKGFFLSLINYL